MKNLITIFFVLTFIFSIDGKAQQNIEIIELGRWNEDSLSAILNGKPDTTQRQVEFLSGNFLGTPYKGATLTGDINTPEIFTINLRGMDCFTYIDYVEALRLSDEYEEFGPNLKNIRYKGGKVSFQNRNHFFSDWPEDNSGNIIDVTYKVGGGKAIAVNKSLNLKRDGSPFLPGIPVVNREFYYIPATEIDDDVLIKLRSGDYVGIYTDKEGLDVTHTGIFIRKDDRVYLRHASSKKGNQKVVDEDFIEYVQNVPGIVVYRPK